MMISTLRTRSRALPQPAASPRRIRHASTRTSAKPTSGTSPAPHGKPSSRASSTASTAAASSSTDRGDLLAFLRDIASRARPSHLWSRYNVLLRVHPLKTRMITSGTLFVIGDMISQHVIEERPFGPGVWSDEKHATAAEDRQAEGHVWVRTARLAFYGTFIFAPLSHNWLRLLERVKLHSKMSTVLAKVALDVSVWGAFIVGVFWTSNGILEGKSPSEIQDKVSAAYLPSWCKSILVFGPSQLFNFSVIPVPHRMLFTQCVGLGWNTFLSFANNRSNAMAEMAKRAVVRVERAEVEMEHAVERVEEKIVQGVMKVADKAGVHESTKPDTSSRYIASSPLETAAEDSIPPTQTHHRAAPSLQRYDEALADELKYQEQLYPSMDDVPSCMTLFDEFLMCYALGPQIRQVYRFGTPQPCTRRFEDFKYCMSLKGEPEDERRRLWVRRRAEWWAGRRVGASSEDVWNVRREPLVGFPPVVTDDASDEVQRDSVG
ncbi:hypothetical protein NliqN6_3773 [Naganishia liquefaciens]|uniref:Mpv17/PMP22 family protein n=1 Tax=Naganishia liquefaciens TaxID=104408 RepID=A0A8H3YH73_9TREE|nr:hypothetical protein NliqN6_3773 [Naganishia liquefaciens]